MDGESCEGSNLCKTLLNALFMQFMHKDFWHVVDDPFVCSVFLRAICLMRKGELIPFEIIMIRQRNNFACQELDLSSCHPPCPIWEALNAFTSARQGLCLSKMIRFPWLNTKLFRMFQEASISPGAKTIWGGSAQIYHPTFLDDTTLQVVLLVKGADDVMQQLASEAHMFPEDIESVLEDCISTKCKNSKVRLKCFLTKVTQLACLLAAERKGRCSWFAQEDLHTFAKQGLRTLVMGRTGHPKKDGRFFWSKELDA